MNVEQPIVRKCVPYMPDSARAGRPNSALPLCMRDDFQQSLDRSRPLELLPPEKPKGKRSGYKWQGFLQYRYLDTGETVIVPNTWYNQTREMRIEWWEFEARRTAESLNQARRELAALEDRAKHHPNDKDLAREIRLAGYSLREREDLVARVEAARKDVISGARFL